MNNKNNPTYQNIINELNKYYNKDNKHNLFSKSLYDQTKKILSLINNQNYKHEAEKNLMLEDTWEILRQNRECGFTFDNSPSISDTESSPALHYLEHNDNKSINYHPLKNQNHLIIGENFYALQNMLLAGYREKIDIIYIDPPYNTKTMKSYADKFGRDGWLSMMYERLKLAKKLLKEDGVIFISIDDNEQAYLKMIMDEIFGNENFICNFIWRKKTNTNDPTEITTVTEYILFFCKNNNEIKCNKKKITDFSSYSKKDEFYNDRGAYKLAKLDNASHTYSKTLDFEFYYKELDRYYYPGGLKINWSKRHLGDHAIKDWQWMWSKEKIYLGIKQGQIVFKNNKIYSKRYAFVDKDLSPITRTMPYENIILDNIFLNAKGTKEQKKIFNKKVFDGPKPVSLIKYLISLIMNNKNALILDFFAGSGTTGHAVMELNRVDKGNRKFILATNNEFIKDENGKNTDNRIGDLCYERLHRIIKGESTKEERNFPWLKKHKPYSNESLNYYEIKELSVSLDKSTPESNKTDSMINSLNEAYKYLNNDFETLDYLQINKNNWFNKLYPLLTNANVALQEKNNKKS